jgi:uncharacterized HAD superfamily protein
MKVLLDFDAVTSNTFKEQIDFVNTKFKKKYTLQTFNTWHSEDILPEEEAAFMWGDQCFLNNDWQLKVKPVEGSVETIKWLREHSVNFIIATDRPDCLVDVTKAWLQKNGIGDIKVFFTQHPNSLSPQTDNLNTKANVVSEYGLNIVIDDAPHHAETLAEVPCVEHVFLFDSPYNVNTEHDKITRVFTWFHILDQFHKLYPEIWQADYEKRPYWPVKNTIKTSGPLVGKLVSGRAAS